ncbi:glutamine--fructose-6-phosphate aminotransferase [Pediococcus acidilactici]|nr:glutamine--fructose-6-phosphate aminotransferase [Pediococcus acidilactici]
MMLNEKELVMEIKKRNIKDVFFAACGGSYNDLFPIHYFVENESKNLRSKCLTARELSITNPAYWDENSLTFVLSHSGNTPEAVEAAKIAKKNGSYVITISNEKESALADPALADKFIVYEWGEQISHKEEPMGILYRIMNEYLHETEPTYSKYEDLIDGLNKVDDIIVESRRLQLPAAQKFAQKYRKQPFMYILGSGANTSQAYGFAICSLMEMQWMDCAFISSAEFFHGPFEVLQDDKVYIQCVNAGKTRAMDTRSRDFIKKYNGQLEVIDAEELGLNKIQDSVVDYFNPMVFYEMGVLYRDQLGAKRGHPTEVRQYMGKVDYSYEPII